MINGSTCSTCAFYSSCRNHHQSIITLHLGMGQDFFHQQQAHNLLTLLRWQQPHLERWFSTFSITSHHCTGVEKTNSPNILVDENRCISSHKHPGRVACQRSVVIGRANVNCEKDALALEQQHMSTNMDAYLGSDIETGKGMSQYTQHLRLQGMRRPGRKQVQTPRPGRWTPCLDAQPGRRSETL